jgi:putative radical SAM enzyme (TIGR03279 family)
VAGDIPAVRPPGAATINDSYSLSVVATHRLLGRVCEWTASGPTERNAYLPQILHIRSILTPASLCASNPARDVLVQGYVFRNSMPVRITSVAPRSLADRLGWRAGDQILAINGASVEDELDLRFKAAEEVFEVRARLAGEIAEQVVERDLEEPLGAEFEEFRIKTCGDDCVFCFVDQNPEGLRESLYFRDGDFRMSFLYGNYITMTNLRDRDIARIVEQRLSPLYASVHATDDEVRRKLMGHRAQQDRLMEKLQFLHDHGIDMHAQIVLTPGYNDGAVLERSIEDLFALSERMLSVSVVPVGITRHREGLELLRTVTPSEARVLCEQVAMWQARFRGEIGRGFVYLSDEMFLLAGRDFPQEDEYDGYPLMENGVGMCRDFLNELDYQRELLPEALPEVRTITMVTGTLAARLLEERVAPALRSVGNLNVQVVPAPNQLLGETVTVSGLLNFVSFHAALAPMAAAGTLGDLVLLPPDCVNFEGLFLDNRPGRHTPDDLSRALGDVPVEVFRGDWVDLVEGLAELAKA